MSEDTIQITKGEAIAAFGGSVAALAAALGISSSAVYQWPDDKPIRREHALMIRFVLKPDVFGNPAEGKVA